MSEHITDELPALLTGDAGREVVLAAASHLRECTDCRQELATAVIAHASLTSARRFAPEIVNRIEPLDAPQPPLPDLSSVFAQVREESNAGATDERRSRRTRQLIAAAAAAIVVGAGTATFIAANSDSSTGPTATARDIPLAPYDTGTRGATATLVGTRLTIDAAALPSIAHRRYEVWLTDRSRTRMQPVGWIDDGGKANLTVPTELAKRFTDIEVSVQKLDTPTYNYSGTSVLRGAYRG